jgi:P4 family phage/plasmid primase-like protien
MSAPGDRWFCWTGTVWLQDRMETAFDYAREICREHLQVAPDREKNILAGSGTVAGVVRMARTDRLIAAGTDDWDQDKDLLNMPNGTLHLPSGDIYENDPGNKITKCVGVGLGGECPRWLRFLNEITDSNQPLIDYLQRVVGYCLTGHTREHALFFLYGKGATGKSTFLRILQHIMADYAKAAATEIFVSGKFESHPALVASLCGARVVIAGETEDGGVWAEARIKSLTGGDTVQARFLYSNPFEFVPEFKLILAGNYKPALRCPDEAMRRRMHLVPFLVHFPQDRQDPTLGDQLIAEAGGILEWAREGALQWFEYGLAPPEIVRSATVEYFEEQDALSEWLESECETEDEERPLRESQRETSKDLFRSWSNWADARREDPHSQKWLSEQLQNRGFEPWRTNSSRGHKRIRLISPPSIDPYI